MAIVTGFESRGTTACGSGLSNNTLIASIAAGCGAISFDRVAGTTTDFVLGATVPALSGGFTVSASSLSCTYSSDGDTNGVFYALGSGFRSVSWINPHTAGFMTVSASGSTLNGVQCMVDRATQDNYISPASGSYWLFDLGAANTATPTSMSFQQRTFGLYDAGADLKLEGSNNGSTWTTLMTAATGTVPGAGDSWAHYTFSNTTAYRYFKLSQPASSSYFTAGEMELYGSVTTTGYSYAGGGKDKIFGINNTPTSFPLSAFAAGIEITAGSIYKVWESNVLKATGGASSAVPGDIFDVTFASSTLTYGRTPIAGGGRSVIYTSAIAGATVVGWFPIQLSVGLIDVGASLGTFTISGTGLVQAAASNRGEVLGGPRLFNVPQPMRRISGAGSVIVLPPYGQGFPQGLRQ